MGSYTLEVEYDENIFEYVSAIGGTGVDKGGVVEVAFYDEVGGSTSNAAVVLFSAKEDIITTVPTNFSVTATNLQNSDLSETYDDILLPSIGEVIIEPKYEDYEITLDYEGQVMKDEAKDMLLTISSALGKNYSQVRIIAEVAEGEENVKLLGKNADYEDFDLIENGFGEPSGDELGGKDVVKELQLSGIFSEEGKYSVKIMIIDRLDSDNVISEETVEIEVADIAEEFVEEEKEEKEENDDVVEDTHEEDEIPTEIPNAGNTNYAAIVTSFALLFSIFAVLKTKKVK